MDEWRQPKEENWWVTVVNRDVELRTHEEHREKLGGDEGSSSSLSHR